MSSKTKSKPRSQPRPVSKRRAESIQPQTESKPVVAESIQAPAESTDDTSKPGRRPGSKNVQRDEVDVVVSRCKNCESTKRTAYGHAIVQEAIGLDPKGKPFTHMIARPCKCRDCGQARRDISYENHPNKTAGEVEQKLFKKGRRCRAS